MRADKNDRKPLVVFAAGGRGSRIQSINSAVPKPLIPVAGKPVLQWEIEELVSQGFQDFIITVSYKGAQIKDYFGDGTDFGCHIDYFWEEQPLGNAGGLFKLWEAKRLSDPFLFLIADACFSVNFNRMLAYHEARGGLATLFTHPNSHPADSSLLVTADDGSGRVVEWFGKEDVRPRWYKNCVNAGLQILSTELLRISGILSSMAGDGEGQRKVDLDRDLLKPLLSTKQIYSYSSPEICRDMGVPERFYEVSRLVEEGLVECRNLKYRQRAVFIDGEGMIRVNSGFPADSEDIEFISVAAEAIRKLNDQYLVIMITNPSVVTKKNRQFSDIEQTHKRIETLLGNEGAYLDHLCHYCDGRDKKEELFYRLADEFNISFKQSWVIGEGKGVVDVGKKTGCSTILICDYNRDYGQDGTAVSLSDAVRMVLRSREN